MAQSAYSRVRVGAVIAAALAVLCFAIFQIGHGSRIFTRVESVQTHFERINGLQTGAPVTLGGVRIGAVDAIEFPADPQANYVVVHMWIERSAAPRVHTDSTAQISSMGLLGDKFVELSAGTPKAAAAEPDTILPSREPIDYEAILQKAGSTDMFENLVAVTTSLRSLLESIDKGHGLLSELIRGDENVPPQDRLSLVTIQRALLHLDSLSTQLEGVMTRLQSGQGVMGAMLSDKTNGQAFLASIWAAAASARKATDDIDKMLARFDNAKGMLPQLVEDKEYANDVLANLRESSRALNVILRKIDAGQGTVGLMVNDPALYTQLTGFIADGGGWGIRLVRGFYNLTHPFASPEPANGAQPVMITAGQGATCPAPAAGGVLSPAVPAMMTAPAASAQDAATK